MVTRIRVEAGDALAEGDVLVVLDTPRSPGAFTLPGTDCTVRCGRRRGRCASTGLADDEAEAVAVARRYLGMFSWPVI